MGKFCIYADTQVQAPCLSLRLRKYSYLSSFLQDLPKSKSFNSYSVPINIDCIKYEDAKLQIDDNRCINCMFCAFGCVGNKVLINSKMHPEQLCVDITAEQLKTMREELFPKLFKGNFINLPPVPFSHIRVSYKSFEAFTSVNETKNIAVWGANAMKFLSSSLEPRVALEVGVDIQNRDRDGRLDISLLNVRDNYLFVAETKVSFEAMMGEFRFESQLLGYESVLEKECDARLKKSKFLLVGGKESDLLPFEHIDSTGGTKPQLFYEVLIKHNFFFISANAMLALGLMKMFVSQDTYNLENLYNIIESPDYLGILSSGVVTRTGDILSFSAIPIFKMTTDAL